MTENRLTAITLNGIIIIYQSKNETFQGDGEG